MLTWTSLLNVCSNATYLCHTIADALVPCRHEACAEDEEYQLTISRTEGENRTTDQGKYEIVR